MKKQVKTNTTLSSKPVTMEINTNPACPDNIEMCTVLKDLLHYGYAVNIGDVYPFPKHVAKLFKEKNLVK